MSSVKIGERHQITIPIDIFKKFRLKAGDSLEVMGKDNAIIFFPKGISPDQSWFFTKEWQAKEAQADKDIAKGRLSKVYDNIDEMLDDLDAQNHD
ncbi:MAG: AbrB/MazE/SpoVT family DNA-binding domain-containing protein [Candidatus Schekmanbacteria bacterium]|nr:AbrB/MazE/SpoVT family DNA-binding domain-containing protein [Candidatus Schekmanbacteria bacterium]